MGGGHEIRRQPARLFVLVADCMGYGGQIGLPRLERIIHIEIKVSPRCHHDIVRFRRRPEPAAVIRVSAVGGKVHASLRLYGEDTYGVAFFKAALLGAPCVRPGCGGKRHKPVP